MGAYAKYALVLGVFAASFFMSQAAYAAGGYAWTEVPNPGSIPWHVAAMSDNGMVIAAASSFNLYISTDGGNTWATSSITSPVTWQSIAMSSNGGVIAVAPGGTGGYLAISTDGGNTWATSTAAGSRRWGGIAVSSDGSKILAGVGSSQNGDLYLSSDSGSSWSDLSTSAGLATHRWVSVSMSSNGSVLGAVDKASGYVYLSNNGGTNWSTSTTAILGTHAWWGIAISGNGSKMVTDDVSGDVFVSADGGNTWATSTPGISSGWVSAAYSRDGSTMAIGPENNPIEISRDGGSTWSVQSDAATSTAGWFSLALSSDGTKAVGIDQYTNGLWVSAYTAPQTATPTAPILITSIVGSSTDNIVDYASNIGISGTSTANAVIYLYDGSSQIASTTANGSGVWSLSIPSLTQGTHSLTVTALASGSTISALSTPLVLTVNVAAPVISTISVTPQYFAALITWNTSTSSDSLVNYGTSPSYLFQSQYSSSLVTQHSVNLTNLTYNTVYHYQIVSVGAYGNIATSTDATFTTTQLPTSGGGGSSGGGGGGSSGGSTSPIYYVQPIYGVSTGSSTITSGVAMPTSTGGSSLCPIGFVCTPVTPSSGSGISTGISSVLSAGASTEGQPVLGQYSGGGYQFLVNLSYGKTHPDVLVLQRYLNGEGFTVAATGSGSPGHETAYFGNATRQAVARFQKAKGIYPAVGYFGAITRGYINSH